MENLELFCRSVVIGVKFLKRSYDGQEKQVSPAVRMGGFSEFHAGVVVVAHIAYRESLFFGVVICNVNIPGVVNVCDGIYKFWSEDDTLDDYLDNFARIGDLNSSPSNPDDDADFSVRVPISTLTSNGWGTWPNASNSFVTGCSIKSLWINSLVPVSSTSIINDRTKSCRIICQTHNYNIGTNASPTLLPTYIADYDRDTTWFDLSCTYTDTDNNQPLSSQLTINDGSSTTYTVRSLDHSYMDGSIFDYSAIYGYEHVDSLQYKWDFDDGAGIVSTGWRWAVLEEVGLELNAGWNLVSLSCNNSENASIFGGVVYGYDNLSSNYYPLDTLDPGKGYWIFSAISDTVWINKDLYSYSDTLFPGWNLIGAKNNPITSCAIRTEPPGLNAAFPYGWNGIDYYDADSLFPGYGYWFLSRGHGRIIVGP